MEGIYIYNSTFEKWKAGEACDGFYISYHSSKAMSFTHCSYEFVVKRAMQNGVPFRFFVVNR